jgi:colanic acid/amylovoran biosynthesis glycosyltransferase
MSAQAGTRPRRVAYVMSRFPKLTETFVLYELLEVARQGVTVDVYPLIRERERLQHPEVVALLPRVRYLPALSLRIVLSNLAFLARAPRTYVAAVGALLRGTWGSRNFFLGALGLLPKTVHAARCMERDGVDHVHCHFASHPAAAGFLIHRLTGIPFSFTAHGSDLHVDRTMLPEKVRAARLVVAVSEYNRRMILEECASVSPDDVRVIHCGVDTELFHPLDRPRPPGPFTIACVGTLHEVKGQAYLLEACRQLTRGGVELRCLLVGSGPDRRTLERQARAAGLADRVEFVGGLTRPDVARLLADVDVVSAPSVHTAKGKREGIPVALMEGMACGAAVVASRLSGIPELVSHEVSGLLVTPRDATGLAAALRRLHDDPDLRRELGVAAREAVLEAFDLRENARSLADLLGGTVRV